MNGPNQMINDHPCRVLLITVRADYGGGPEHVWQILKHGRERISFYIACPQEWPYWKRYSHAIPHSNFCEIPHRRFTFGALARLIRFIRQEKIQLIHTHGKGAGAYGRLACMATGIPCIHTPHGIHTGEYGTVKKWFYVHYEKITSRWIKHICFVSPSEQKQAYNLGLWPQTKSTVIPNGVDEITEDTRVAWRKKIREKLDITEQQIVVAMLTRFDYPKNMLEAYDIAKKSPEIIFLWLGDGQDRNILAEKAKLEQVGNIVFTGFVDNPGRYLAASDIYLSTSRWEGMPLGILEAMSVGLPVVATDVVGNRDAVIDGTTGILYPLGKTPLAVSSLKKMLENREDFKHMSQQAVLRQRKYFSTQRMVADILHVYQTVLR